DLHEALDGRAVHEAVEGPDLRVRLSRRERGDDRHPQWRAGQGKEGRSGCHDVVEVRVLLYCAGLLSVDPVPGPPEPARRQRDEGFPKYPADSCRVTSRL